MEDEHRETYKLGYWINERPSDSQWTSEGLSLNRESPSTSVIIQDARKRILETSSLTSSDAMLQSKELDSGGNKSGFVRVDKGPIEACLPAPRPYFQKLKNLKEEVYRHSALAVALPSDRFNQVFLSVGTSTAPEINEKHGYNTNELNSDSLRFINANWSLHEKMVRILKDCQTAIQAASQNIERLRSGGFCQSQISILSVTESRPLVADMVSVNIKDIMEIAQLIQHAINSGLGTEHADASSLSASTNSLDVSKFREFTKACDELLSALHLGDYLDYGNPASYNQMDIVKCWCNAARVLDLAVILYAGAHLDAFPAQLLSTNAIGTAESYPLRLSGIQLRPRSLKCLSPIFRDKKVWVLHCGHHRDNELYLSVDPDALADIWGPMWQVHRKNGLDNDMVLQYNIGSGALVPWDHHRIPGDIQPKSDERLAHWMPYDQTLKELPASVEYNLGQTVDQMSVDQDSSESEPDDSIESSEVIAEGHVPWGDYAREHPFSGNERLLIGAQTSPRFAWNECHCSTRRTTHKLKESRCLHYLETSRLFHYVDTRNINMSIGTHGLTLGASLGIKAQSGRPWKEVLLEAWENQPFTCNPKVFESFWGVVVSLCTHNARRVRLVELLGTDSIRNLLRPFRWSHSNIKDQFYKAVTSSNPRALSAIWEANEQWREELGKALLACVRALCQTGFDSRREEFNVLWMSTKSAATKRVVLKPSEHNWIRILQDSEDSLATAVMVKKWMGPKLANGLEGCRHGEGQCIPTRLETALTINQKLKNLTLQRKKLHREEASEDWRTADHLWKTGWDVSCVEQGDEFWIMSPDGRLKTVEKLSPSHLLLKWDLVKRDEFRQLLGLKPGERFGHWEYTDEEVPPPVRPIPVHIQADK